ncbi:MAG: DUF1902 domain-containing protein [Eubacterium sp.]|nr:DUF1902 domain-containing protein [Eubacterium sp.]
MEYVVRFNWDDEAKVWYAINDYLPLALESESLDELMSRVRTAIPEMIEVNNLEKAKYLYFFMENREEVTV